MNQPAFIYAQHPFGTIVSCTDIAAGSAAADLLEPTEDAIVKFNAAAYYYIDFDMQTPQTFDVCALQGKGFLGLTVAIRVSSGGFAPKFITGATQTNPCVVSIPGHGYTAGEIIKFSSVGGMTQLNGQLLTATIIDADTISVPVNATVYSAYTSGGLASSTGKGLAPVAVAADDSTTYVYSVNSSPFRHYRLYIPSPPAGFQIAYAAWCRLQPLPYLADGHDPSQFTTEGTHLISPDGRYLGSSQQRCMLDLDLDFGQVTDAEFALFQAWAEACVKTMKPFFYVPDTAAPACSFGWADEKYKFAAPYRKGLRSMGKIHFIGRRP